MSNNKFRMIAAAGALAAMGNVAAFEEAFALIAKSDIESINISGDYALTVYDLEEEGNYADH